MAAPDGRDHVLLSEWAGRTALSSALPAAAALIGRSPCPVCGHPTYDCTHDVLRGLPMPDEKPLSKTATTQQKVVESVQNTEPRTAGVAEEAAGKNPEPTVIRAGDTVADSLYEQTGDDVFVTVKTDVVEEFTFPNSVRKSHRLLYSAGQVVRKADLDAANARAEAAAALKANGGVDPENPAGIDATTIASGTRTTLDK